MSSMPCSVSEQGNAVCPDRDGDTYVDCGCPTAPPICDCDDADPSTHPNAPEACDATKDFNCNGHHPEACATDLVCNESICIHRCGIEFPCSPGATCQTVVAGGTGCVPTDCTVGGCPPGATCDWVSKKCVPKCDNVVCPPGEKCLSRQGLGLRMFDGRNRSQRSDPRVFCLSGVVFGFVARRRRK